MSNRHTLAAKYIDDFFRLTKPCSFIGCEELRKEYITELRTSQVGGGCAACRRMSLMSKYKQIVKNRVEFKQNN